MRGWPAGSISNSDTGCGRLRRRRLYRRQDAEFAGKGRRGLVRFDIEIVLELAAAFQIGLTRRRQVIHAGMGAHQRPAGDLIGRVELDQPLGEGDLFLVRALVLTFQQADKMRRCALR